MGKKKKNIANILRYCILAAGILISAPSIALSAQPGLDLVYNGLGAATSTSDAVNPFTAIQHWVKIVDYDGIANDGSSHTVTVTYPSGGPTYNLLFYEKRDANSAIYEFWDDTILQPIDPVTYSGIYTYRVEDSAGDWSMAEDDLQVNTLSPPNERTFSPGFSTPRSIIAHFDDVYRNGVLYDDFESGFDPAKWDSQPAEVVSNETQTVAPGAITIDGDTSDWASLSPALVDPQGDSSGGSGADLKYIYTAMDDTYAYVMVETHNKPISPDAGIEINFNYKSWQHHTHGPHDDLGVNIGTSTLDAWNDNDLDGELEPYPISGYTVVRGNVMEARIPLSEIENAAYFSPTFVNIWTAGAPPGEGDDPSSVEEAIAGEVHFERSWFPESQTIWMWLNNPETVNELKATVRVESISSNDEWIYARVGGAYCRNDDGEVYARVGIKGNDTYITVYSEYRDGDHLIDKPLLPRTSLGPVTRGNRYELTLEWYEPGRTFNFGVRGLEDSVNYTDSYTVPGPVYPADDPSRAIGISSWVILDTTPTFDWQAVPGANHYRVRIYGLNDEKIYEGYPKSPPYTLPPGILKPDAVYRLRVYALRDHQWFEWDNVSRSVWDTGRFFIETADEVQDPYIDLRSHGVYTWTHRPPFGPYTHFNIRIHDPQGVPDNIESVKVTLPDGHTTVNLYYDEFISPTEGKYRGTYFGGTPADDYTFTVIDKDGNPDTKTETLTPNPIDYPAEATLFPAHNTLIGGTSVNLNWQDVTGAAFYELTFYDKDNNYLFNVKTTESQYTLPPGLLKEKSLYRYRIYTRSEFFEGNQDNGSTTPPYGVWNSNTFITTATYGSAQPILDIENFGVAVWHAPHPDTGDPYYELNLTALVTDADGVPENIARVEVTFPDGSIRLLKYDDSPNWGFNYSLIEEFTDSSLIQDVTNSTGLYTFKVVDFDDNEVTAQDTLPNVSANILPWATNVLPADGTELYTITPTISWDPVSEAAYYKVRIMSAWAHPTVHWSGALTNTWYTIPDGILSNGHTYGYRVYAFKEPMGSDIDFLSCYSSWHATNNHFTIQVSDTGPVIDAYSADVTSGLAPLTVEFSCTAHDADGSIVEYRWDYDGDGSVDETTAVGTVSYSYTSPGTYLAFVTVMDDEGALATSNPITIAIIGDTDSDGMSDDWETLHGFNPLDANDANLDSDDDGLSNLNEYLNMTHPHNPDTDGDTVMDGADAFPLDPNESADSDGDGIGDIADPDDDNDNHNSIADGGDDCDDFNPTIHPDATEIPNNGIDEDCDGVDPDTLPPFTEMIEPPSGASNVAVSTNIIAHVKDTSALSRKFFPESRQFNSPLVYFGECR